MWAKCVLPPVLLIIQFLVIFQISYGKPTTEEPFNHSTTSESVDIDVREDGDVNSSFLETVSVLLTVISPNGSASVAAAEEYGTSLNNTANSTTTEPEYYDDHNLTTSSSTLNELEADEEDGDLSMLGSVHLGSSTESSSLLSSLITEEMEVADSLDESVTATMLALKGDGNDVSGADDGGGGSKDDDDDGDPSRTTDDNSNGASGSRSRKDTPSSTDDSIIIASMSSNLNVDTVEPLSSYAINTDSTTQEDKIISSSHLLYDGSSSPSAPEPTFYSFTEADIHNE